MQKISYCIKRYKNERIFSHYLTPVYPIWRGQAPKIMYTFIEYYNLSGKTVIPFCTSASSRSDTSATNLQAADTSQAWATMSIGYKIYEVKIIYGKLGEKVTTNKKRVFWMNLVLVFVLIAGLTLPATNVSATSKQK